MVAPSPRTPRPPPRPGPRPLPASARRRPPPYQYGPPRRHGRRRLLVLVLVLATIGAAGYLYLTGGGSNSSAAGFVSNDQQLAAAAQAIPTAAAQVHRFAGLHKFETEAQNQVVIMSIDVRGLQQIGASASGRSRQIVDQAVSAGQQAIVAAGRYRHAVAFTYRLADADSALRDLNAAVASLQQQAQAWQHT